MNKKAQEEFESVLNYLKTNKKAQENFKRFLKGGNKIGQDWRNCVYASITGEKSTSFARDLLIPKEISFELYPSREQEYDHPFSNLEEYVERASPQELADIELQMKKCISYE